MQSSKLKVFQSKRVLYGGATAHPRNLPITDRRSYRVRSAVCKVISHEDRRGQRSLTFNTKLQALIAAAVPLVTALPAGAHEVQYYFQLASPGLAIVIGSLAFAASSPRGLRGLAYPEGLASGASSDPQAPSQKTKEDWNPTKVAAVPTLPQAPPQPESTPAQPALAFSQTLSSGTNITPRETDARGAEEPEVRFLEEGMEEAQGRGRMLLMAFAGQYGRSGSLAQGASADTLHANPLSQEKGILQKPETSTGGSPAKKAKDIVNYVMEWSGLDAREAKKVASNEQNLQSNVVPLPKTSETRELVAAAIAPTGDGGNPGKEALEGEGQGVASISAQPTASTAPQSLQKSAAELQEEHKTIIDGLKSQITSIANVAVSAEPQVLTAATPARQQKEYNEKLGVLKQSAVQKKKEEEDRWQKRASVVNTLNVSSRERVQAGGVEPYRALTKSKQAPKGLAKLHPKVLMGSIMETVLAVWTAVVNTARKLFGQKPPGGRAQTA